MSSEKTFTVVGVATNPNGTVKARWANDLVSRIKILDKAGCTDIQLIELPSAMTKLEATQYFLDNTPDLSAAQREVLEGKVVEKSKTAKRREVKATLTKNVRTRVKTNAPVDARVEKFVKENAE